MRNEMESASGETKLSSGGKKQNTKDTLILWFPEVGKENVDIVGGKGANLGELIKAGMPVPFGFIVTSAAYFLFLEKTNLTEKIKNILEGLDTEDSNELQKRAKEIQEEIKNAEMPEEIKNAIIENYKNLATAKTQKDSKGRKEKLYVAVRSSATAEDLPDASFAGQQETYLNISGEDEVLKAVKDCWASLFGARAIYYRAEKNFDHFKVGIAVPVQMMVQSEKSGIMFTIDPVTNDKSKIIIEGGFGLGEAIVSGSVTPDRYIVDKESLKLKDKEINSQDFKITRVGEKDEKVSLSNKEKSVQKLTDKEILKVAELGKKIEEHYKFPQDIEWAIADGDVFMVQSRPVTTLNSDISDEGKNKEAPMPRQVSSGIGVPTSSVGKVILKGAAASLGIASGPVQIIHLADQIDEIKKGDVLVTEMTTPDYVPAMKRASAIVTDKGGRTCFGGEIKILTNKGFKKIKDIITLLDEEELYTPSLNRQNLKIEWKKIIAGFIRKANLIRTIISQSGNSRSNTLDVTLDHKMITFKDGKLVDRRLNEILDNEKMVVVGGGIPSFSKFTDQDKKLAYFLGAISTDGSVYLSKTHGEVQFIQKNSREKQAFIKEMQNCLLACFGKTFKESEKSTSDSYIRDRHISGTAVAYRCYSKETATLVKKEQQTLAQKMLIAGEEIIFHFLAGVIDGDGSYNQKAGRINIFCSKEYLLEAIVVACLRLNIVPQIVNNRSIKNVQIVERVDEILSYTKRVKGIWDRKKIGTRFLGAKNLFESVKGQVNYKGRIKPYIEKNLLLDSEKIKEYILPLIKNLDFKEKIEKIINSKLRMYRVNKLSDLGLSNVYNITVDDNHNYFVFTEQMTPVLVNNCHAAIVSRELGIPCVVGTETATETLKGVDYVTVDGAKGLVYKGKIEVKEKPKESPAKVVQKAQLVTATRIYVNLGEPELAAKIAKENVDGVGLLRAEFIIMEIIKEHPRKMVKEGRQKEFIDKLAEGLEVFAREFYPRPVVYRATDFKTNEYRNLPGGEEFEPEEENPMIGYRGCFRYTKEPEVFNMELEAVKKVRKDFNNLHLMIPFVRRLDEFGKVKELVEASGLKRSNDFKLWIMVEVPSTIFLIDKFCQAGIDGISIGSNDLTQLILGLDRDSSIVAEEYDERDEAVQIALKQAIETCKKYGVTASICGQAPSVYPEICEKLVEYGVTSISVNPDVIDSTRQLVASVEEKLLLKELSDVREELNEVEEELKEKREE